jgi:hypothetical protein
MGQREPFLGVFKLDAVANNTNYIYKNFKLFLNKEVLKICGTNHYAE